MKIAVFLLVSFLAFAVCDKHAVFISGAGGKESYVANYPYQADCFHAYTTIGDECNFNHDNIILMNVDDVAFSPHNKHFTGEIFNEPGQYAVNVRPSTSAIDYRGRSVTPDNFLKVLEGMPMSVYGSSNRTLTSGPDDDVFIYINGFGGSGVLKVGLTTQYLYADQLMTTLKMMHVNKMYRRMVIMLESTDAASMFNTLPDDMGILAIAATRSTQVEDCYCGKDIRVRGYEQVSNCLAHKFTSSWFERIDGIGLTSWTIKEMFEYVKGNTSSQTATLFGDMTIAEAKMNEFFLVKN
eukprot:TRINITY_DN774210_c0_g1_i1.p1 TRINITY_DN774210_c0_g1~~TRINITY_DN774210_c0_g1_i1.p1  ORF type:complete len:296 (+),score=70.76 TRINITY_DN774210_c0_g1_i1:226-1113(+)